MQIASAQVPTKSAVMTSNPNQPNAVRIDLVRAPQVSLPNSQSPINPAIQNADSAAAADTQANNPLLNANGANQVNGGNQADSINQPAARAVQENLLPQNAVNTVDGSAPGSAIGNSGQQRTPDSVRPEVVDPLMAPELTLADVIASVAQSFPVIEQARLQRGVVGGEQLSAYGFYDHKLQGYTLSDPTGVYRNYRQSIGLARQLWWGGYLSAGYRLGRGDFEPWYKERETDKSGEYKLSLVQPLLQGRAIDPARTSLFQANIRQQAVGPEVDRLLLTIAQEGAVFYWTWVAIGSSLEAQRELFELAETRTKQLEDMVKAGKNKSIDLVVNQQLIAERQLKVIQTEQKFRETGFKLSLYLRDPAGQPLVPPDEWLPKRFPRIDALPPGDYSSDLAAALAQRPELRALNLDFQHVTWDLRLARNQLLPQLDLITEGSQDAGDPASSANDKSRFELEVGLQGEVPIQRRKALGKIQSTNAKLAQLQQKIQFQREKIGVELQTARTALVNAERGVIQSENALRSAINALDGYNTAFTLGKVDLVYLNLLESKATEAEIKLIESQLDWFAALAAMQAALGLDPIEQSIQVSNLPPSNMPMPRNLPKPTPPQQQ